MSFPLCYFFASEPGIYTQSMEEYQSIKLRKIKSSEDVKNTRARFMIYK